MISLLARVAAAVLQVQPGLPPLPSDVPAHATIHLRLIRGEPRGQQAVWRDSTGALRVVYIQSNPRCQGLVRSTIRTDAAGIPTSITHDGATCPAAQSAEERFSVANGRATWRNRIDRGDSAANASRFYISLYDGDEGTALLARALLSTGRPLLLWPGGEARIERVQERRVNATVVTQYHITGLDLGGRDIWLDDKRELFAVSPTLIRKGSEAALETLRAAEDSASRARNANVERLAVRRPSGKLVIHSARLFDAIAATVRDNQTVVVSGSRIESVRPTTAADRAIAGAIDASGLTLLPGLWDSHGHNLSAAPQLIAAGVTTIRVLAANVDMPRPHWSQIETGRALEPRIVPIGIIDGPQDRAHLVPGVRPQVPSDSVMLVRTADDVRRKADEFAAAGYRQMKMYDNLFPSLAPVMIAEAHQRGMRSSGHIPFGYTLAEAVDAGLDEVHHASAVVRALLPGPRSASDALAQQTADIDVNGPDAKALVAMLRAHHVTLDPTLVAFEERWLPRRGEPPFSWAPLAPRLPVQMRRQLLSSANPAANQVPLDQPDLAERQRRSFAVMLALIRMMADAGVPTLPGTDIPSNGFALLRELELHVQAGIPPARVLQSATLGAARVMKLDREIGSIEPGKLADLVLVAGDPTHTISDIRRTRLVVKDGAVIDVNVLYEAMGIAPTP